jgi:hypothetical protein
MAPWNSFTCIDSDKELSKAVRNIEFRCQNWSKIESLQKAYKRHMSVDIKPTNKVYAVETAYKV